VKKYSRPLPDGGRIDVTWMGAEVEMRMRAAMGKGLVMLTTAIVALAKEYAHVGAGTAIPGTLRRSIHSANIHYTGEGDMERAQAGGDIPNASVTDIDWGALGMEPTLLVGSWVDYACVEEVGRGHQFIQPAVESARAEAVAMMKAAFKSEGFGF
jgi:hypothetical protein